MSVHSDLRYTEFLFNTLERKFSLPKVSIILYKDGLPISKVDLLTRYIESERWDLLERCVQVLCNSHNIPREMVEPGFRWNGWTFDLH